MNQDDHFFSPIEQKYYNYYLSRRKQISKPFMNYLPPEQQFRHYVDLIESRGHVEFSPEYLDIEEDLKPIKSHITEYYSKNKSRVLQNPFNISGLFELVRKHLVPFASSYYGCIPTIGYIKIIKSQPSSNAKDTQFFHRDPGSYNLLKAVIYINDVDSEGGPLVYVQGSNKDDLTGISGRSRLDDKYIQEKYKGHIKEITESLI